VKSGIRGTIKSLHSYVIKKQADLAIRISSSKPSIHELTAKVNMQAKTFKLVNIPFYMINNLEGIINEAIMPA